MSRKLNLRAILEASFPDLRQDLAYTFTSSHIELLRWRVHGLVDCRVSAYAGEVAGLDRKYRVSLTDQAKTL